MEYYGIIRQQRSVFEGMTPRYDKSVKYKEIFWLNPDEVIGYVSSEPLTFVHDSATLPYLIKCAAKTGKPVVSYDLFAGSSNGNGRGSNLLCLTIITIR